MEIVVVGLNHRSAPVDVRERLAFTPAKLDFALRALRGVPGLAEGVIVSTCNRVEIYGTSQTAGEAISGIESFLHFYHGVDQRVEREMYRYAEPRSIEHLFRVVSGLDSMVFGETEVLGQVKQAYERARACGNTGKALNQFFQRAFQVAKKIRSQTQITRGSISVGSVSVELAEKIFGDLAASQVMIIGAGDTGEKTARSLQSRGAHAVLVANRTHDRAEALAAELGGRAVRFDRLNEEMVHVDIVISSVTVPHYIVTREKVEPLMAARQNRPLFLIDLGVPRNIEPAVNELDNVYLYNIDDLQEIANANMRARQEDLARCNELIAANVEKFRQWLRRLPPQSQQVIHPASEPLNTSR
ncbi:MAG: glutamyl-tRNA reductase [Verrucomicrobiae bacterium]|nr:glutamyl-tRNA reductase [Verrucomicrobiae bacterium]